jgi:hypothetical protein
MEDINGKEVIDMSREIDPKDEAIVQEILGRDHQVIHDAEVKFRSKPKYSYGTFDKDFHPLIVTRSSEPDEPNVLLGQTLGETTKDRKHVYLNGDGTIGRGHTMDTLIHEFSHLITSDAQNNIHGPEHEANEKLLQNELDNEFCFLPTKA